MDAYDEHDPRRRVRAGHADDSLAEALGQSTVRDLTGGGHDAGERDDEVRDEELGGPYVESAARDELGTDDESEPEEVEAAARPTAQGEGGGTSPPRGRPAREGEHPSRKRGSR